VSSLALTLRTVRARASKRHAGRGAAGLTLIEIIVVLTLIAVITGVAIAGSNQLPSTRLRRSGTLIASAIKAAYVRATSTSRDLRLVMDIEQQRIWIEESEAPMLVRAKDPSAAGGAEAVTEAEKQAHEEGDRVMKGPPIPKPSFRRIVTSGVGDDDKQGTKSLQRGITFRAVQTAHDDEPRKSGRAYLYFWPGGLTERAAIQVRIGDSEEDYQTLTLLVAPLTGRVTIKNGPVELELPTDDEHASDRQDNGF
jgi:general secretion pathway protein H